MTPHNPEEDNLGQAALDFYNLTQQAADVPRNVANMREAMKSLKDTYARWLIQEYKLERQKQIA